MLPTDTDPSFPHHSGSKTLEKIVIDWIKLLDFSSDYFIQKIMSLQQLLSNKIFVKITIITMQFRKGSKLFS